MAERRTVVYKGIEALGIGTIEEQVKNKLGIDIKNNPYYEIEWSGFSDNEGISTTGYTEFKVVRVIPSMDPPIIPPVKPIDGPGDDEIPGESETPVLPIDPEINDEELTEKIQDMIDKYYGNREKERQYHVRIKRFKSHIKGKIFEYTDSTGNKIKGVYKTVGDYPEKAEDEKFLQLEDFSYKLERLSRAEAGDIEMYREPAEAYEKIKMAKLRIQLEAEKDESKRKEIEAKIARLTENKEESIQESIRTLQEIDADYIVTNNYAYNQHQTTQTNLMTLGKYGEQVPYLKFSKVKDAKSTKEKVGRGALNGLKGLANVWLFGRNKIAAPIDKAIGTYMVAPVHRLLYDSEKSAVGVYKGIASHRYTARKDYFTQKYLEELAKENQEREARGEKLKQPSIMKLVFGVRKDAITRYKEGNIAVASAGATDIEQDFERRENEISRKEDKRKSLEKTKTAMLDKISLCKAQIKKAQNEEERLDWEIALKEATTNLLETERRIEENELRHIDGLIQTDAVSMAQRAKANKANVTRVVSCVKTVARLAAMRLIGKNITKEIAERTTEEVWVPEQTITTEQLVPGQITVEKLEGLTMGDLMSASKADTVSYFSGGGSTVKKLDKLLARGMSIIVKDADGSDKIISISDGLGFDIAGRTDFAIDSISNDTGVLDVVSELMTKAGNPTIARELAEGIANSPNPQEALIEFIESLSPWVADNKVGMPDGWLDMEGAGLGICQDFVKPELQTVTTTIPGHMETIISETMRRVLDGRMLAAEIALAAGGARDLYELARRNKSKEEMKKEGTHKAPIKPHEKDNKPKERRYDNNKWGFDGTEKGDRASLYDEATIEKEAKKKSRESSGMDR